MNAKRTNRSCSAFRIRRSKFHLVLLSTLPTGLLILSDARIVLAADQTEQHQSAPDIDQSKNPILKSVGIRFITETARDSKGVVSVPSPANEPKSLAFPSQVTIQSVEPPKVVKMSPMVAGPPSIQPLQPAPKLTPAVPVSGSAAAVKIEMASVSKTLAPLAPPPQNTRQDEPAKKPLAAAKPVETVPLATPPLAVPSPETPLPMLNAGLTSPPTSTMEKQVDIPQLPAFPQASSLEPPKLTVPSDRSEAKVAKTTKDLVVPPSENVSSQTDQGPKLLPNDATGVKSLSQAPEVANPSVESRTPNVVRIPSMTLSSRSSERTESVQVPNPSVPAAPPTELKSIDSVAVTSPDKSKTSPDKPNPADEPALLTPQPAERALTTNSKKTNVDNRSLPSPSTIPIENTPSPGEAARWAPAIVAIPAVPETISVRTQKADLELARTPSTDNSDPATAAGQPAMTVELTYRDAQNIKLPGVIKKYSVDDESVCKIMTSESNGVMLLGVGRGATQVKVWLDSGTESSSKIQIIDVSVSEAWSSASQQRGATLGEANQLLAELYPTARIVIRSNENGSLTIFGRADSDEQAKQIASLIRKVFLVPIQDRIAIAFPK